MLPPRAVATRVVTMPPAAMVDGKLVVPKYWAKVGTDATLIEGPKDIHAIKDPDPIWNPATSGWFTPPPASGVGDARWTVLDLPDPASFDGGWYWLGDPSSADGTASIQAGCHQWAPNAATPHAPIWRSFFPFKPSVRAVDSFLPGGNIVHHPKGVHFNAHYIEHMWMNFPASFHQPLTVLMVAMVPSFPRPGYTHALLDAGRNPDTVGFPRLSATDVNTPRQINDSLAYRSALLVNETSVRITAREALSTANTVRCPVTHVVRPKMYFGIFNGSASAVGAYDTGGKRIQRGHVDNGSAQQHRFWVMGRTHNWIDQDKASHVIVMEVRLWHRVLSDTELAEQYAQLSSTYQFDRYRAL